RWQLRYRVLASFPTRRSSDLPPRHGLGPPCSQRDQRGQHHRTTVGQAAHLVRRWRQTGMGPPAVVVVWFQRAIVVLVGVALASLDRKSTRLNSSHVKISYAVF